MKRSLAGVIWQDEDAPGAELRARICEWVGAACYVVADRIESWAWWCEVKAEKLRGDDALD